MEATVTFGILHRQFYSSLWDISSCGSFSTPFTLRFKPCRWFHLSPGVGPLSHSGYSSMLVGLHQDTSKERLLSCPATMLSSVIGLWPAIDSADGLSVPDHLSRIIPSKLSSTTGTGLLILALAPEFMSPVLLLEMAYIHFSRCALTKELQGNQSFSI